MLPRSWPPGVSRSVGKPGLRRPESGAAKKPASWRNVLIYSRLCPGSESIRPADHRVKPTAVRSGKTALPVVHELPKTGHSECKSGAEGDFLAR